METYCVPDTLVSTSVENILIYLHILLIGNIRVNCSFYIYK